MTARSEVTPLEAQCDACKDTGEIGNCGFLDCTNCDAADKRIALNAYMQSMRNLSGSDRDWAIFQYAQKQAAAVSAAPSGEVGRDVFLHGVIAALGALAPHHKHGDVVHDEIVRSVGKEALYRAAEPDDVAWAALDPEYYAQVKK